MKFEDKLNELYIDLPEPPPDMGNILSGLIAGKNLYVGGMLPFSEGKIQYPGRVGVEIRLDNAKQAAKMAATMAIAVAKRELKGDLSKIKRVVRVDGFVACGADFRDHAKVMDGASELFAQIFSPFGKHVRTVAGCVNLPQNACVEIAVTFEIK